MFHPSWHFHLYYFFFFFVRQTNRLDPIFLIRMPSGGSPILSVDEEFLAMGSAKKSARETLVRLDKLGILSNYLPVWESSCCEKIRR